MYLVQAKTHSFKIISLGMCFALVFSSIFPTSAFASRSDAGGGELAEFDVGSFALSVGISLGSMAIGSAINAGVSSFGAEAAAANAALAAGDFSYVGMSSSSPSFLSAMGDSLTKSFNINNMVTNYSTFVATSQVGRAVGTAGQYYGWNPSTTFLVSNITSAATGGFLNPSVVLGDAIPTGVSLDTTPMQSVYYTSLPTMAKGALVGGITGMASGAAIVAIDGSRMNDMSLPSDQRRPGVAAQITGMVAGVAGGNFSRALVNPEIDVQLLGATFIKPADMPRLAARSLAIVASNYADKDSKFFTPSTVSSLVEGAALPMFKGLADNKASFSLSDMGFGLFEGAVHGSTSYLISKVSKDDPLVGAAAGYGATLVSGAIRGAVQRAMWDPQFDPQRIDEAIKATDSIQDKTIRQERKQELTEYKATMAGDYPIAILTSMDKANRDFLDRTFSFGAPHLKPEKVDSLAMVDYFSKLNSYAAAGQRPDWFASGLTSSMTSASSFATAKDLITTLGAFNTNFTRNILNIAPYGFEAHRATGGKSDRDLFGK